MSRDFYKELEGYFAEERRKAEEVGAIKPHCDHEFTEENVGQCLTLYTCRFCGHSYEIDSSD
jgi:hypothetical protein